MDSEDEDSADAQYASLNHMSKRRGHSYRAVNESLNKKSLDQLPGSYPAAGRENSASDVPHAGHVAFSSRIVSKSCWF